jgi:hypothetical protein
MSLTRRMEKAGPKSLGFNASDYMLARREDDRSGSPAARTA